MTNALHENEQLGSPVIPIEPRRIPREILLVEDHPHIRNAMHRLISQAGFNVTTASTVAEGLSALEGKDCLLLDLNLPDGCGVKLLKHIREHALPIRVAVITATGDPKLLAEVAGYRPEGMFQKPFDIARLMTWLERIPLLNTTNATVSAEELSQRSSMIVQHLQNFSWHLRWPRSGK